jgi:hypothetical protein
MIRVILTALSIKTGSRSPGCDDLMSSGAKMPAEDQQQQDEPKPLKGWKRPPMPSLLCLNEVVGKNRYESDGKKTAGKNMIQYFRNDKSDW